MDGHIYFHPRQEDGDNPAGLTVSKRPELPAGDFIITAYSWGATLRSGLWTKTSLRTMSERLLTKCSWVI